MYQRNKCAANSGVVNIHIVRYTSSKKIPDLPQTPPFHTWRPSRSPQSVNHRCVNGTRSLPFPSKTTPKCREQDFHSPSLEQGADSHPKSQALVLSHDHKMSSNMYSRMNVMPAGRHMSTFSFLRSTAGSRSEHVLSPREGTL